jgi:hypothetical protein
MQIFLVVGRLLARELLPWGLPALDEPATAVFPVWAAQAAPEMTV